MKEKYEIMVLDDEPIVCERLQNHLQKKGFSVETFTHSSKALDRFKEKKFDVVITDLKMAGPDGIDVLVSVKGSNHATQVIVITGYPDFESKVAAEYKEAFEYVLKPFKLEEIERLTLKAARKARKKQSGLLNKLSDFGKK